jgi:hypothetical protein
MIIHGFSKNEQTAKQLWTMVFISFGKYLLRIRTQTVLSVPNNRFSWKRILLKKYTYRICFGKNIRAFGGEFKNK